MAVIQHVWPWLSQPQEFTELSDEFRSNALAVWKPFAGPVGPVDGDGYGLYSAARTDVFGRYPLHGYAVNGSTEVDTISTAAGLAWSSDGTKKAARNMSLAFAANDFTMLVQFSLRTVTGSQIIFAGVNGGNSPPWQYGIGFIADGTTLRAVASNNNATQNATYSGLEVDVVYTAVMVKKGAAITLYCNGARSTATGSASPYQYGLIGWLAAGHLINNFSNSTNGWISLSGIWTEAFSDDKADLLHREPLLVFAPRTIWVPVSAGGGPPPTFNPAWARNSNTVLVGGRL